jgi:hypothetical protein
MRLHHHDRAPQRPVRLPPVHNYRQACKQGLYREEALAEQFQRCVRGIQLPPKVPEWARDILKESLDKETDLARRPWSGSNRTLPGSSGT